MAAQRRAVRRGGALAALLDELLRRRWLRRHRDGRALTITSAGRAGLAVSFGVSLATIGTNSNHR